MAKSYIVVNRRHWSPPPAAYVERFRHVMATHAGKVIISSGDMDVQEGSKKFDRLVVIEFADKITAVAAYEQYHREASPLLGPVDRDMLIVEGVG